MDRLTTGILGILTAAGILAIGMSFAKADDQPPVLQLPDTAPIPTPRPEQDIAQEMPCAPLPVIRARLSERGFRFAGFKRENSFDLYVVFANARGEYGEWKFQKNSPEHVICLVTAGDMWVSLPVGDPA